MKKVFDFFIDKILRLYNLFVQPQRQEDYIYERDFLNVADYGKNLAVIFKPVTDAVNNDFEKIYNIKTSLYHDNAFSKMKYYIENRFWGLFSVLLLDGYHLDSNDFFNQPSLIAYLVIDKEGGQKLVIVKSKLKQHEVIAFYNNIKGSVRKFKERKLVFSKEKGFYSL